MDEFSFTVEIPLRLRDLDAMNHVNNAVYATFLEQARAAYFHEVVGRRLNEVGMAIADLSVEFERAVHFDDDAVTVGVRAADLGTSSIPLAYEVWTGEERVATAETTMVHVDRETGRPTALPDEWRTAFESFEGFES